MSPETRWRLRLQTLSFYVLFGLLVGLLAWLSTRYVYRADWTEGGRNSVSEATRALLEGLESPLSIEAYVPDDVQRRQRLRQRVERLRRVKDDIALEFVNPELEPDRAQAAGLQRSGQLLLSVGGRRVLLEDLAERTLAQALQRLVRGRERWIVFWEGHGERDLADAANPGYSTLADRLKESGLTVQPLNLVLTPAVPDNTAVLVVAAPQFQPLPGEVTAVLDYLDRGGNLLWLHDPGDPGTLAPLARALGVRFVPGVLVDANPQLRVLLGIRHPAVIPVVEYPDTPLTTRLRNQTLFPFATGVATEPATSWRAEPLLVTLSRTWSETGALTGEEIGFSSEEGDTAGPLPLGLMLTRTQQDRPQRAVVVGDSDFMANGYLGHGANLELALNLFNWLSEDEEFLSIVPGSAPDTHLDLSDAELAGIALIYGFLLPLGLVTTGVTIWWVRRRR